MNELTDAVDALGGARLIVWHDGTREWLLDDRTHREGGPAIEYPDGSRNWYRYGRLHREDGPAVETAAGYRGWWLDNEKLSEGEWSERVAELQAAGR